MIRLFKRSKNLSRQIVILQYGNSLPDLADYHPIRISFGFFFQASDNAAPLAQEGGPVSVEFAKGDRVKIKEGSFQNFEGHVDSIDETKGIVTVLLTIFGRATPVDVEYWQLEKL